MHKILPFCVPVLLVAASLNVSGQARPAAAKPAAKPAVVHPVPEAPVGELEAVVETELGEIRFEFAPDKAPKHVENFMKWASTGFYDGSAFHRTIQYAIIQGGDPGLKSAKTPKALWGTAGLKLQTDEFSDMKHLRGVVSTVRIPGQKNSDGAQFFFCVTDQPALDGQYSAFGRITEGIEIVEKISLGRVDGQYFADAPVRIKQVTIQKKKTEPYLDTPVSELKKIVRLETALGVIRVQMEPEWAPNHVRNFLKLASLGWYDGTGFHRISKGFVVQGGTAASRASGAAHAGDRWVHPVKGEFRPDLKHVRGIVSMARASDPDSAVSSFFLVLAPAAHLDGQYSVFGRVIEGLEVLEAFEKEEVEGETPKRRLELVKAVVEK